MGILRAMAAQLFTLRSRRPSQAAILSIRGLDLMNWLRGGDIDA